MKKAATRSKVVPKKRGQGRPVAGENEVGRERLVAATEKLLRTLPPARVTISRVAKEAGVDSALVRYYFGNRTALLVAVVDHVTSHGRHHKPEKFEPVDALAKHIGRSVQFIRSASFMHRLVIEELMQVGTEASRARVKAMNLDLVQFYRKLLREDGGSQLIATDPLLLHLLVLGASDFFASAEPLIRELVPAGTNMDKFAAKFQHFLIDTILSGLRKR